jgi:hypothetical protein
LTGFLLALYTPTTKNTTDTGVFHEVATLAEMACTRIDSTGDDRDLDAVVFSTTFGFLAGGFAPDTSASVVFDSPLLLSFTASKH